MEEHLKACRSLTEEDKLKFRNIVESRVSSAVVVDLGQKRAADSEMDRNNTKKQKTAGSMVSFLDRRMDDGEKNLFWQRLLDAFVSGNISFATVENPEFRKMLAILRPTVQLPCRRTLSGNLLNRRSIETDQKMAIALADQPFVNLSLDSWTDVNAKKLLGKSKNYKQIDRPIPYHRFPNRGLLAWVSIKITLIIKNHIGSSGFQ
jgi:hypothetical protein